MAPCIYVIGSVETEAQKNQHFEGQEQNQGKKVTFSICLLLALAGLIPIVRACSFLYTSGIDIPSNDDVIFFRLIERMSVSDYNWLNYFRDTLINGHSFALGLALFWLNCILTAASQTAMLSLALILLLLRVLLMNDYMFGKYSANTRLAMFLPLSLILFAPSQTTVLAHPTFAATWQLSLLMSLLSIWALARFPSRVSVNIASTLAAVIGCWTTALSLTALPLLFVQVYLNGKRSVRDYTWAIAASVLSLAPYLASFTVRQEHTRSIADQILGFDFGIFLNILGRPFASGTGTNFGHLTQSFNAGLFGLVCMCLLLFVAFKLTQKERMRNTLMPSLLCIIMGLETIGLIATARPFIAPTNSSVSSLFWCGLLGLALYCFSFTTQHHRAVRTGSIIVFISVILLSVCFSKTFEDKQYYLANRAPFAASLVRNFAHAPTYATRMIFKLVNLEPYTLAMPLEKNAWSIFAPHREYLLQGDFALNSVEVQRVNGARVFWVKGTDPNREKSWKNYNHLNLALQGDCTVFWHVKIPPNCISAKLHCKILGTDATSIRDTALRKPVLIKHEGSSDRDFADLSKSGEIDLKNYCGQAITICFHSNSKQTAIFKYPRIEVVAPPDPLQTGVNYAPENVLDTADLHFNPAYKLETTDPQKLSIHPRQSITHQNFESLDFLTTGRPALINCTVRYKSGNASAFEIPIFGPATPAVYTQPGRIFDDYPDEIEEISLVNNSPGALSDYITAAYLRCHR
ncbi:MAG: hypothetical protein DKT66_03630 [Candidatus Melainabacteria bacterium]|nr:MAG: hypothetical protein DKT66_03630 [Candidatus Melainabacteria bacterium]